MLKVLHKHVTYYVVYTLLYIQSNTVKYSIYMAYLDITDIIESINQVDDISPITLDLLLTYYG